MLEGLLDLQELNMYGNKVAEIIVPHNPKLLSKLEMLNLGYNDLAYIPEDLDRLRALRVFKAMNNFLEKVPMRVCDMDLKTIDVSNNPVIQPPIETCERGISSMKRYYHCIRVEEQSKQKALEAVQQKAARHAKKGATSSSLLSSSSATKKAASNVFGFVKPMFGIQTSMSLARKSSDDSNTNSSSVNHSERESSLRTQSLGGQPQQQQQQQHGGQQESESQQQSSSRSDDGRVNYVSALEEQSSSEAIPPPPASVETPVTPSSAKSHLEQASLPTSPGSLSSCSPLEDSPMISEREKSVTASIINSETTSSAVVDDLKEFSIPDQVTVNDTLKVIFVGMAMAGKTSMIKRLMEGEDAVIPKQDERTVGVDIYEWNTKKDRRFEHIDSRIDLQDKELEETCGDVNVKFSVWDFAGQHVYHATHELFFSQRALYVLVWDMGATNSATLKRKNTRDNERGAFKLSYDSSDEEDEEDDDFVSEEEARRADRALERDIDEKVQFWVDCIQSSVPGAAILPVASFDDLFSDNNNEEAKRRCNIMKQRLLKHEERRIKGIKDRLKEYETDNRANDEGALRLRKLLCSYTRPKLIFSSNEEDTVVRVSGTQYTGFATLTERIINIATGRDKGEWRYPLFRGHVGARIPRMRLEVREAVRTMRDRFKVVEWGYFINQLRDLGLTSVEDISDALHFLANIGELSYFGNPVDGNVSISILFCAADDSVF
jgi:GTPase SAR1 family protein